MSFESDEKKLKKGMEVVEKLNFLSKAGSAISDDFRAHTIENLFGTFKLISNDTFLRFPAAAFVINLPTSVEPVKATLSTCGWDASGAPASSPNPVTKFNTPSGSIPES